FKSYQSSAEFKGGIGSGSKGGFGGKSCAQPNKVPVIKDVTTPPTSHFVFVTFALPFIKYISII
ncbi:hypothetical protein ACT4UT_06580, partial [Bacillus sp. B-TM1]